MEKNLRMTSSSLKVYLTSRKSLELKRPPPNHVGKTCLFTSSEPPVLVLITSKNDVSLYRDDSLIVLKNKMVGKKTGSERKKLRSLKIPILVMKPSLT